MDELTRKALVDTVENVIADYDERELRDIDLKGLNRGELAYIYECLQFGELKEAVCEWTEYGYKAIRSPHERCWSIISMKDFKYCPYCRKRIKIVRQTAESEH